MNHSADLSQQRKLIEAHKTALANGAIQARLECMETVRFLEHEGVLQDDRIAMMMAAWTVRTLRFCMAVNRE